MSYFKDMEWVWRELDKDKYWGIEMRSILWNERVLLLWRRNIWIDYRKKGFGGDEGMVWGGCEYYWERWGIICRGRRLM